MQHELSIHNRCRYIYKDASTRKNRSRNHAQIKKSCNFNFAIIKRVLVAHAILYVRDSVCFLAVKGRHEYPGLKCIITRASFQERRHLLVDLTLSKTVDKGIGSVFSCQLNLSYADKFKCLCNQWCGPFVSSPPLCHGFGPTPFELSRRARKSR